jgi:hypothetical protein
VASLLGHTRVCDDHGMADDVEAALKAATRAFRRAERAATERRNELAAAIRAADAAGVRQVDIIEITGYAREHVRRILRKDAEPAGHDPVS